MTDDYSNSEKYRDGVDAIWSLLKFVGEDAKREGLKDTPDRVLKAWQFWCSGYTQDPKEVLRTFADGAEGYNELVVVRDLPVYSHCEHHMAPFFGKAHIAYLPNKKIVGLSKLGRLLEIFARRLQVQERLTTQIADALVDGLQPQGVAVVLECRHMCMESRGIRAAGCSTVTSALRGGLYEQPAARAEVMQLLLGRRG